MMLTDPGDGHLIVVHQQRSEKVFIHPFAGGFSKYVVTGIRCCADAPFVIL